MADLALEVAGGWWTRFAQIPFGLQLLNASYFKLPVPSVQLPCKRRAAVEQDTECLDSMAAFLLDDQCSDGADVPYLAVLSARSKDNIVFYVAGFAVHFRKYTLHCVSKRHPRCF